MGDAGGRDKASYMNPAPCILIPASLVIGHSALAARCLNLNVDARGKAQLVERFNGFGGRLNDVDQALVRTNLELLSRFLIDVRTAEHGVALDPRRKWDRSVNDRIGPLGRVDDFRRTLVENRVIVRFHPDANDFLRSCHV